MTGDIDEAIDWQGRQVDCGPCAHRGFNESGRCALKHACVRDRYARRIDRFFTWNPALSNAYLDHPHFVASLLEGGDLVPMMHDEDYYVRLTVARRIGADLLPAMMADEEAEVRRVVASRIGGSALYRMASDEDTEVRLAAVRRLEPRDLTGFHRDPDWRVRYEAACRASPGLLGEMINDPDEMVREFVLQRLEQVEARKATNVVRLDPRPNRQTPQEPLR